VALQLSQHLIRGRGGRGECLPLYTMMILISLNLRNLEEQTDKPEYAKYKLMKYEMLVYIYVVYIPID
jgi:hypothetical protein